MASYNFEIGEDTGSMMNLEDDLGLNAPHQGAFIPTRVEVEAADGLVYGHGWGETSWHWGFISTVDRAILRAYCPNRSAAVVIRVRDEDAAWMYFNAVMIWPQENEIPNSGIVLDFSIQFRLTENLGASV